VNRLGGSVEEVDALPFFGAVVKRWIAVTVARFALSGMCGFALLLG